MRAQCLSRPLFYSQGSLASTVPKSAGTSPKVPGRSVCSDSDSRVAINILFFLNIFLLIFHREEGRGIESQKHRWERYIDQLPPAHPPLGMCPQPMYMPLTGIEPGTFQSTDRRSIHWAKPVSVIRAIVLIKPQYRFTTFVLICYYLLVITPFK